jgi:hypothetical protein
MDPEFACRKPALFNFYKNLLNSDPFPNRSCEQNNTVMMSSPAGFTPVKIDISRVYRVDYLLASPGADLSSGFGHAMFRIVMCAPDRYDFITKRQIPATPFGPKCLEDKLFHLVVSYRANVQDATLSFYKGIFGGYPSMLFILNFSDVLDEYNKDELRDVISYPLKLSNIEKKEFIEKVIEEHWNYRGSYKFFTNNCAVESEDLLKFALGKTPLVSQSSLTPSGVLLDLDKTQFVDSKSSGVENYIAKTSQLISAFKLAYGYKSKNSGNDLKNDKNAVLKFVRNSKASDRLTLFQNFQSTPLKNVDLHSELLQLKEKLLLSSSFSVLEQQTLRTFASDFKKRVAELFLNSKDNSIKEKLKNTESDLRIKFEDMSKTGYGVPLNDEVVSNSEMSSKLSKEQSAGLEFEKIAKELMPNDFDILAEIQSNLNIFNDYSIKLRKEYRTKLEEYIHQVIHNLTLEEDSKNLLISIHNGDHRKILDLRNILDANLVSEREILDSKLINFINLEIN